MSHKKPSILIGDLYQIVWSFLKPLVGAALLPPRGRRSICGDRNDGRVPDEPFEMLLCPITQDVMVDPVLARDGFLYERTQNAEWLTHNATSPMTNQPMGDALRAECARNLARALLELGRAPEALSTLTDVEEALDVRRDPRGAWALGPELDTELPPPQLGREARPEAALAYLHELLELGLVLESSAAGAVPHEVPQVPLQSYLALEQSYEARLAELGLPADEGLQIVHKLLLDLFNGALREEAARAAAPGMAFRGHGYAARRPLRAPPSLETIATAALQRSVAWLELGQQGEGMPIEVRLSCLLSSDAAEVERATDSLAEEKDRVVAEVADSIMLAELRDLSSLVSRL